MEESLAKFILEHGDDDTSRLILSSSKFPGIDVKVAATMIEARRKAAVKLPQWYACHHIEYPSSLSMEQCSSETTALYKQRFVPDGCTMADITGGLGVDCFYMSRRAKDAFYFERSEDLCRAATNNFAELGATNIKVTCSDHIDSSRHYNLIYADPARRGARNERVFSVRDCEPDMVLLKNGLLELSERLLIKISPMADVSNTMKLFPEASQIHIVSTGNECKELLVFIDRNETGKDCRIVCTDITQGRETAFEFTSAEENGAVPEYADHIGRFLYQPYKAVLKGGAFKLLSERLGIGKLAPSTHLYTSDRRIEGFPGKVYEVEKVLEWSKSTAALMKKEVPAAEMLSVNFPVATDELRRRLGITEGTKRRILATTLGGGKDSRICIICRC